MVHLQVGFVEWTYSTNHYTIPCLPNITYTIQSCPCAVRPWDLHAKQSRLEVLDLLDGLVEFGGDHFIMRPTDLVYIPRPFRFFVEVQVH